MESAESTAETAPVDADEAVRHDAPDESVSWERSLSDSRRLRWPATLAVGAVGGVLALGVVLLLGTAVQSVEAAVGAFVVVALALALGLRGPLAIHLSEAGVPAEQRPIPKLRRWVRPLEAGVASLAFAGAYVGTVAVADAVWPVFVLGALGVGAGFLASAAATRGSYDPATRTLTGRPPQERTVDLDDAAAVRRVDVGETALCWLSYPRGTARIDAPRLLVLPLAVADRVERDVTVAAPERNEGDRAVRVVAYLLALPAFAVGAFFLLGVAGVGPAAGEDSVVLLYPAGFSLAAGLLLAGLAYLRG
jgi:hypothetical protein